MQTQQLERVINGAGLAFGVLGAVAPKAFLRGYGAPPEDPMLGYMTRLWGTRTAALCTLGLLAGDDASARRRWTAVAVGMNALDTLIGLSRGSGVPSKTKWQGTLTSGAFTALGAWALSRSDA